MDVYVVIRNQHSSTCVAAVFRERMQAEARAAELRQEWNRVEQVRTTYPVESHLWAYWDGAEVVLKRAPLSREGDWKLETVHRFPSHIPRLDRAHARKPVPLDKDVSWRVEECEVEDWHQEGA